MTSPCRSSRGRSLACWAITGRKTTLVRQMVNLLRPTSGTITLYGRPLAADPLRVPATVGYSRRIPPR